MHEISSGEMSIFFENGELEGIGPGNRTDLSLQGKRGKQLTG